LAGSSLAGLLFWRGIESGLAQWNSPGAARRFTGSYEISNPSGAFPTVSWLLDNPPPIDVSQWQLVIDGEVERPLRVSYDQLLALMQDELEATIDCTGGWYSTQIWRGVGMSRLLREAGVRSGAQSVSVEAVSGYWRRFALDQIYADRYLLATHVAGQTLNHGHGFPTRWVAMDHRGFDWVKWVNHIEVTRIPAAVQPPLPLR
jgi:DMSO/TMAO reductase YedYZ molybdopterin-dependent catalytic subunit